MNKKIKINIYKEDVYKLRKLERKLILCRQFLKGSIPLIWVEVPLMEYNEVTWNEQYIFYASSSNDKNNLFVNTYTNILPKKIGYIFENGQFNKSYSLNEDYYEINYKLHSNNDEILTFGLATPLLEINGSSTTNISIASAVTALPGEKVIIIPNDIIAVFIQGEDNHFQIKNLTQSNIFYIDFSNKNQVSLYREENSFYYN